MTFVSKQSTNHIMMMEPVDFYENPQTRATNSFQKNDDLSHEQIQEKALAEFRAFRDLLVAHGIAVTTVRGQEGCPDDIFCNNWVSTHHDSVLSRRLVFYPMLTENRAKERRPELMEILRRSYNDVQDFTLYEQQGKVLESTGAMCMDRVHKIGYQIMSDRSNIEVGKKWCDMNGYEHFVFDTDYNGKPVYHADIMMWIGSEIAGICRDNLKETAIIDHLKQHRDVIEFTTAQMENFCGNSLEVLNDQGERVLVMSKAGYGVLDQSQKDHLSQYYKTILTPQIPTIEYYGGGSARCMLLELF